MHAIAMRLLKLKSIFKKNVRVVPKYSEVLLNNRLDKDFQRTILPFKIFQTIYLNFRYIIRDNFITSNTPFATCLMVSVAFAFWIAVMCFYVKEYMESDNSWNGASGRLVKATDFAIFIVGYITNTVVKIRKSQESVELIIKVHKVHSFYKNEGYKTVAVSNVLIIICSVIWFIFEFIYWHVPEKDSTHIYLILDILLPILEIDMIYAICVMKLMRINMQNWKKEMKIYSLNYEQMDLRTRTTGIMKLLQTYKDLMQAYKLYQETLQIMVLFNTVKTFAYALLNTASTIIMGKLMLADFHANNHFLAMVTLIFVVRTCKNFIYITLLAYECDQLNIANQDAQSNCTVLMKSLLSNEKRVCKNIRRLYRTQFTKMSICGVYTLDAELPLKLLALIATYTIVLLQAALVD